MNVMLRILVGLTAISGSGCITTKSEGFVNYKVVGDVYGTKPQAVDYEEVGVMKTDASGFFWTSCDNICKDAVVGLKDKSKDRGGDSVIDVSYKESKILTSKTPTCITDWNWGYLGILPVFGPWVKTCDVEGVAVARAGSKQLNRSAQEKQASPSQPINININNTQNNGGPGSPPEKPAH